MIGVYRGGDRGVRTPEPTDELSEAPLRAQSAPELSKAAEAESYKVGDHVEATFSITRGTWQLAVIVSVNPYKVRFDAHKQKDEVRPFKRDLEQIRRAEERSADTAGEAADAPAGALQPPAGALPDPDVVAAMLGPGPKEETAEEEPTVERLQREGRVVHVGEVGSKSEGTTTYLLGVTEYDVHDGEIIASGRRTHERNAHPDVVAALIERGGPDYPGSYTYPE